MSARRVALYARVSTAGQDTDMQLREMRLSVSHRGWRVAAEYVDHGVSGTKANRPELDRMMASARAKEVDAVMVWRFDRFGRSVIHLVEAMNELNALGIAFVSLNEAVDTTTSGGKLVFTIFSAMAEFERDVIVERVNAGLRSARARGVVGGRPRVKMTPLQALTAWSEHGSLRAAVAATGVSRGTLRLLARRAAKEGR